MKRIVRLTENEIHRLVLEAISEMGAHNNTVNNFKDAIINYIEACKGIDDDPEGNLDTKEAIDAARILVYFFAKENRKLVAYAAQLAIGLTNKRIKDPARKMKTTNVDSDRYLYAFITGEKGVRGADLETSLNSTNTRKTLLAACGTVENPSENDVKRLLVKSIARFGDHINSIDSKDANVQQGNMSISGDNEDQFDGEFENIDDIDATTIMDEPNMGKVIPGDGYHAFMYALELLADEANWQNLKSAYGLVNQGSAAGSELHLFIKSFVEYCRLVSNGDIKAMDSKTGKGTASGVWRIYRQNGGSGEVNQRWLPKIQMAVRQMIADDKQGMLAQYIVNIPWEEPKDLAESRNRMLNRIINETINRMLKNRLY